MKHSFKLFLIMTIGAMLASITMSFTVVAVSPPQEPCFFGLCIYQDEGGYDYYNGDFTYCVDSSEFVLMDQDVVVLRCKRKGRFCYSFDGHDWYLFEGTYETILFDRDYTENRITLTHKFCP